MRKFRFQGRIPGGGVPRDRRGLPGAKRPDRLARLTAATICPVCLAGDLISEINEVPRSFQ